MKQLLSYLMLKPKKVVDPNAPRYADVYGRAVAGAIDILILFYLLGWLLGMVNAWFAPMADIEMAMNTHTETFSQALAVLWHSGIVKFFLITSLIHFLIIGIYWVGCQAAFHTTPGKWIFGYSVVRNDDHTQRPTHRQYIVRYLAYLPSCAPLMLGLFLATFRKDHRALHDRIAGTAVLNSRPKGWLWKKIKRLWAKPSSTPVE